MRQIIIDDAISWLRGYDSQKIISVVASMPDFSEFPQFSIEEWKNWFQETSKLILTKTSDEGVSIFYQSDIKYKGQWIDKSFLIQKIAEELGYSLLWHKIICRVPPGNITFGRPAYSHIICFSKNLRLDTSKSTADVIPHLGEKTWERGMGVEACIAISKFIIDQTPTELLLNPFCGMGSMVSVAEAYEINVIGIEKSQKRAKESERIQFNKDFKKWF